MASQLIRKENPLYADLERALEHPSFNWNSLKGARIFITGGTGFFGLWLLHVLLHASDRLSLGLKIVALTRSAGLIMVREQALANHPSIEFWEGEIERFRFPSGSFSHLIHAAFPGVAKPGEITPLALFASATNGTRRAMEFALEKSVQSSLFVSSGAIYGHQPLNLPLMDEGVQSSADIFSSEAAYGEAKRASEFLCGCFFRESNTPVKIARCFTFLGPYLPLEGRYAVGNFVRDGIHGGPIVITGNRQSVRSYLYGSDLAVWLLAVLMRGKSLRPYNIGSEQAVSIDEVASLIAREAGVFSGREISVIHRPQAVAKLTRYVPSTARARDELGLVQVVSLEEAIRTTIAWNLYRRTSSI